ncbi:transmembrane and ubiquitin-like domain-containing protein 1 [Scylla paramamosain]|uniref:transmembrane and ubiquitin-like domain-containing protein 1 n=1 Tax=Scylla paramamosain TaxID=85552 RepID=UPI003082FB05
MLSYDGLQDVLTAAVVVVAVAVVVAAAWISTSVREQPLVATAVVVFHSGGTVESSGSSSVSNGGSGGDVNTTETQGSEAAATSMEKDSESMHGVVQDSDRTQPVNSSDAEAAGGGDVGPGGSQGASGECSPPERMREDGPEMEVRRRRLQHFVSMGGAADSAADSTADSTADTTSEERLPTPADTDTGAPADARCQEEVEKKKEEEEVQDGEEGREERPPGSIRIRLKFLDETQRHVFAQLTEKVGSFKRQHFSIELDANRHIRLIFNGQLLSQDSSTLAQYGLFDNCVVHCHVSQPQLLPHTSGRSGEAAAQEEEDAYVSRLLAPLLYAVMVLMWYLRYEYGHLFNTMSTIILLFLTALLLISTYLLYVTHHVPEGSAATHIPLAGRTITRTSSTTSTAATSPASS